MDDDEYARYLASYLYDNQDNFLTIGPASVFVNEEKLYQLIKDFKQELP